MKSRGHECPASQPRRLRRPGERAGGAIGMEQLKIHPWGCGPISERAARAAVAAGVALAGLPPTPHPPPPRRRALRPAGGWPVRGARPGRRSEARGGEGGPGSGQYFFRPSNTAQARLKVSAAKGDPPK